METLKPTFRLATLADARGIVLVHTTVQRAIFQGILPDKLLHVQDMSKIEAERQEKLQGDVLGQTCTFVAEDEQHIIGFATGGPAREGPAGYDSELYNIFVLDEYQHRGIGSALFLRVLTFLQDKGHRSLMLWVTRGTAAPDYYTRLQGEKIAERSGEIKDHTIFLDGYGWRDMSILQQTLLYATKSL